MEVFIWILYLKIRDKEILHEISQNKKRAIVSILWYDCPLQKWESCFQEFYINRTFLGIKATFVSQLLEFHCSSGQMESAEMQQEVQ